MKKCGKFANVSLDNSGSSSSSSASSSATTLSVQQALDTAARKRKLMEIIHETDVQVLEQTVHNNTMLSLTKLN